MSKRTAIVLFNLGGPDSLQSVKPFLFNLFRDPAILRLPWIIRYPLARFIAARRSAKAERIYASIGGRSPIVEQTRNQADALEKELKDSGEFRVFTSMRYWHPLSREVAQEVKQYAPDKIVLLPLYPQFSTTTTVSSLRDWEQSAKAEELVCDTATLCCWPAESGLVAAHAELIREQYWNMADGKKPRLLFSAHGLPQKIIDQGDPYAWQIEQTVAAIVRLLAIDGLDFRICYQSRVGPLQWTGPSTQEEITRAGADGVPVLAVPVSFVSEHSETLAELDIEYRALAASAGVPAYERVPALGTQKHFIDGLKALCLKLRDAEGACNPRGSRLCPRGLKGCHMEEDYVG